MAVRRGAKKRKISWRESDAKYMARGMARAIQHGSNLGHDVKAMNQNRAGYPFKRSDSMMALAATIKIVLDLPYLTRARYLADQGGDEAAPNHQRNKIGNTMPEFRIDKEFQIPPGGVVQWVIGNAWVRDTSGGEWIRVRWKVKQEFFKLHILVDLGTRLVLAFCLTDMNGGDTVHLPALLDRKLQECASRAVKLPDAICDLVVGDESSTSERAQYPDQALLDRWTSGHEDGS